jgi:hypothetical protein
VGVAIVSLLWLPNKNQPHDAPDLRTPDVLDGVEQKLARTTDPPHLSSPAIAPGFAGRGSQIGLIWNSALPSSRCVAPSSSGNRVARKPPLFKLPLGMTFPTSALYPGRNHCHEPTGNGSERSN